MSKTIQVNMSKFKYVLLAFLVAFSFSCSPEDGNDGAPGPQGEQGPQGQDAFINITAFTPTGCQSVPNVNSDYQKITDLGDFTKLKNSSFVEIDYQTNFSVTFDGGATAVVYQLRVDDNATTLGKATVMLKPDSNNLPAVIHGVFPDLAEGAHTISVWVNSVNGTATDAYIDSGCFNNYNNNLIIKEFM